MKTHHGLQTKMFLRMSPKFLRNRYGMIAFVLLSLALVLVVGCVDINFYVGTRPDLSVLEDVLKIGQSSEADVLAVLGAPSGKGKEMFPIGQEWGTVNKYHQKQRTMWSYYFEKGNLKDDRRIFLFVFFDSDRYDGYMWFSSLADASSQASKIGSHNRPSAEPKK